jgi:hypothetical protein
MKKLILLFLFFSFINLFSQEYHFDYSIETQTDKTKPDKEKTISTSFYDSKNKVHLHIDKYNDKMRAVIYDRIKNLRHSFKVTEGKGFVTFEYSHTNDFSKDNHKSIAEDDILEVVKRDSLQYQIVAWKNAKKKRKRFSAIATLEKSKFNYLEIGIDHSGSEEIEEKVRQFLEPNSNYVVKSLQVDYWTGYSFDSSFKIAKVDFKLKVPEKLIIKDFDFFGEFQD